MASWLTSKRYRDLAIVAFPRSRRCPFDLSPRAKSSKETWSLGSWAWNLCRLVKMQWEDRKSKSTLETPGRVGLHWNHHQVTEELIPWNREGNENPSHGPMEPVRKSGASVSLWNLDSSGTSRQFCSAWQMCASPKSNRLGSAPAGSLLLHSSLIVWGGPAVHRQSLWKHSSPSPISSWNHNAVNLRPKIY